VPLSQSLWLWILHACAKRDRLLLSDVESMVQQLLEPFTPLRRAILRDALLGRLLPDIAASKQITERTVANTLGIAATLIERAA
jgi:DNA-binding NarL/FixJ family response regulator